MSTLSTLPLPRSAPLPPAFKSCVCAIPPLNISPLGWDAGMGVACLAASVAWVKLCTGLAKRGVMKPQVRRVHTGDPAPPPPPPYNLHMWLHHRVVRKVRFILFEVHSLWLFSKTIDACFMLLSDLCLFFLGELGFSFSFADVGRVARSRQVGVAVVACNQRLELWGLVLRVRRSPRLSRASTHIVSCGRQAADHFSSRSLR